MEGGFVSLPQDPKALHFVKVADVPALKLGALWSGYPNKEPPAP